MSMPAGAGVEATLYCLDLLAHPRDGSEAVHAEAWCTIRHEDVFLSVDDATAAAAIEAADAAAAAHFDEADPRFGQHVTAAVSTSLEARGLPYGARLYAYHAPGPTGPEDGLSLTDDAGGGYVAQWDTLDAPRLQPVGRVRRAWAEVPEDVRETLGV